MKNGICSLRCPVWEERVPNEGEKKSVRGGGGPSLGQVMSRLCLWKRRGQGGEVWWREGNRIGLCGRGMEGIKPGQLVRCVRRKEPRGAQECRQRTSLGRCRVFLKSWNIGGGGARCKGSGTYPRKETRREECSLAFRGVPNQRPGGKESMGGL